MTFDRKIIVGIEDVKSVSLECNHCGVRITFAPDSISAPCNCPNPGCNKFWAPPAHSTKAVGYSESGPAQIRLLNAIPDVLKIIKERNLEHPTDPIGFHILLEFDDTK